MDAVGADFFRVIEQIKQRLGSNPLVISLPVFKEECFSGIIDLIKMKYYTFAGKLGNDIAEESIPS